MNVLNYQKYKKVTSKRLDDLEKTMKNTLTLNYFRREMQVNETRTMDVVRDALGNF